MQVPPPEPTEDYSKPPTVVLEKRGREKKPSDGPSVLIAIGFFTSYIGLYVGVYGATAINAGNGLGALMVAGALACVAPLFIGFAQLLKVRNKAWQWAFLLCLGPIGIIALSILCHGKQAALRKTFPSTTNYPGLGEEGVDLEAEYAALLEAQKKSRPPV